MFWLVSSAKFKEVVNRLEEIEKDYREASEELLQLKEKYWEWKVYSQADRDEREEGYSEEMKILNDRIESLIEKNDGYIKTIEWREDALQKLAEHESINDIEYFIRKDIKKFEDFKKEFIEDSESKYTRKLAEAKAKLQNEHLDEQKSLYTHTAGLIFSPRMAGKALGNNSQNEVV